MHIAQVGLLHQSLASKLFAERQSRLARSRTPRKDTCIRPLISLSFLGYRFTGQFAPNKVSAIPCQSTPYLRPLKNTFKLSRCQAPNRPPSKHSSLPSMAGFVTQTILVPPNLKFPITHHPSTHHNISPSIPHCPCPHTSSPTPSIISRSIPPQTSASLPALPVPQTLPSPESSTSKYFK